MSDIRLILGDCLEVMKTLQAGSVDAVITDIPYFEIVKEDWDRQWEDRAEYIEWVVKLAHEWKRITKDNSSIFLFCDEKTEAYIQVRLDELFLLLNKIVWYRKTNEMKKYVSNFRRFAPATERALFYTTQYDSTGWETVKLDVNNFVPLREYFRQFQEALGMNKKEIITKIGQCADHAFRWNSTQWDLPTPETYAELCALPLNHEFIRRDYEDLRRDYEDLRRDYEFIRRDYEDLRRPFNADNDTFDVLEFPAYAGEEVDHPTVKSVVLMRRIVTVITNPGQVVLDCCMGSGTTGVACVQTGRKFIGIEIDEGYFQIAEKRIKEAQRQPPLFV